MTDKYILVSNNEVEQCDDLEKWGACFESANRIVAKTDMPYFDCNISTVFLGIDHSYGKGPPILFETMIFGGEHNDFQVRCSTWNQAVEQHLDACLIAAEINEP